MTTDPGPGAIRLANDVLAFAVELAALGALMVWGFTVGPDLTTRIVLAAGAPALFAVAWGLLLAPRATRRLTMPWLLVAKVVVFAVAVAALAAAGHPVLAAVFAAAIALNLALATAWGRL